MIVAGDPSGDLHTAPIVAALLERVPSVELFGIGGPAMQQLGFEPLLPFEPFNRMGFVEIAANVGFFLSAKRKIVHCMKARRPAVLLLVDYPGLNIRLLMEAHALGIPTVWYIAPQVWAWKRGRAETLGRCASFIGTVFPFEVPFFAPFTDRVAFVGHPLAERLAAMSTRSESTGGDGSTDLERPCIGILPGSRRQEVSRILKPMVEAFSALKAEHPELRGVVSRVPQLPQELYREAREVNGLELRSEPLDALLPGIDLAMVTSGTATLQAALYGIPMVIAYRTGLVNYLILRHVIHPPIGLPNIVAEEGVVPECHQAEVSRDGIKAALEPFIASREHYRGVREKLLGIRAVLGERRPSEQISGEILTLL